MKQLLVTALIAITLFSCTKQSRLNSGTSMTAEALRAKYFIELPNVDYGNGVARNNKPKANAVVVVVWSTDLVLSGSVTCTVSPGAEWGAIQKFLAEPLSNDGAVSYCNFNWSYTSPSPMDCPTSTPGVYRGWTSDHDYNIHISNLITIN